MESRNSSCDSPRWDLEKIVSEKNNDRVNDALQDKVVFLTGATGMLGIALVVKMTLDTTIDRVYVLVRGGSGTFVDPLNLWKRPLTPVRTILDPHATTPSCSACEECAE